MFRAPSCIDGIAITERRFLATTRPPARNDGAVIPKERAKDQRIHEGCVRLRNLCEGIALSVRAM